MDCRETLKQIVVPIFYDAVPSDVQKQTGVLQDAFAKHKKRRREESNGKVEKWRAALTKAANLSGRHLLNEANGGEAELIKMIIKDVREMVNPTHLNVPDLQVGLERRVGELSMLLNMEFNYVGIVAIWGMGGIGKTTIAKRLFNLIQHKFECSSFFANVRETSERPNGLDELQKKLLLAILKRPHGVSNFHEGIAVIKKKAFGRKKVLLVLDDVDNVQQLEALAIDRDSFAPGSRIIITTRDESLLKILKLGDNEIYEPEKLDKNESLELFSWHAFRENHHPQDHLDLSRQIGHYAGGLPLALEDREDIHTSITLDDLRQHYGRKRKDAAESLGVSVSTLKRTCRQHGIKRWPNIIRKKAGRPHDQYGGKNPSPTLKSLSTNGQTEMENQMVGLLEETNEFLLDFVEGPNEGGVSSEWAFQLKNQCTVSTSYPNSNGPEVPHPHIASTQILGENMGSLGDRRNSFCSLEEHLLQGQISGSMWTVPPCSDPASSQHIPTISPTMGSSEDRINSLAFLEDVLLEEDVSGSISWTIPSCSEPAPGQLMPIVPQTTGSSDDVRNLLPLVEESFLVGHVSGFINPIVPSCSYPAPSQPMSTVPHTTGSSDDLRILLASVEEPFRAGHVSESINLTVPSCSDPTPSQSVPTILHKMPTNPRMMPLLTERQDTRSVNLKATYEDTTIKFQFPLASGINELKEEVSKILECVLGSFDIEYEDEDGDWILMARDENFREYLQLLTSLGKQVTKLKVRDKVPKPRIFVIDSDVINSDH